MLHQIGVGALGPVFRTYEPSRDRLVAVKAFRLDITPEQAHALADELTRAAEAGLFHPSIVEPIAAGVQGTLAYRAEEYVAAESLDVAMRHYAPADVGKVLPFITQLAGAIDFARAGGVGHGALHPRDVFVTPDEARSTGFGVVDALERVGLRAPVRRPYSPPERVAGEPWGTPADVFSLAAIAFELLTGRRPAGTGGQIGSLSPPVSGPPAEQMRRVLARAMHEDPARRYQQALAFAAAFEAAARGEAVEPESVPAAVASPSPVEAPPPQPAATVPVATAAAVAPLDDDIAIEREEDNAHWDLLREEREQAASRTDAAGDLDYVLTPPLATGPIPDEADPDAGRARAPEHPPLRFEADEAPVEAPEEDEPRFADELAPAPAAPERTPAPTGSLLNLSSPETPRREPRPSATEPPPPRPARVAPAAPAATSRPSIFTTERYERPAPEPRVEFRTAMLPLAVTLVVGLLLGFAAGYFVGERSVSAPLLDRAGSVPPQGQQAPAPEPVAEPRATTEQAVSPTAGGARPAPPSVPSESAAPPPPAAKSPPPSAAKSPPPPAPVRGRIVVRSTPSRAAVTLNGKWTGRTPLTIDGLAPGNYALRVVADGYRAAREEVELSAGQTSRTVTVRLERERAARGAAPRASAPAEPEAPRQFSGTLFVDSRPQGAKVFVDGKEYGTTPVRIPDVPIGSRVVRLELPDHRVWTSSVRIVAGEERRVTGSLEPIRGQ